MSIENIVKNLAKTLLNTFKEHSFVIKDFGFSTESRMFWICICLDIDKDLEFTIELLKKDEETLKINLRFIRYLEYDISKFEISRDIVFTNTHVLESECFKEITLLKLEEVVKSEKLLNEIKNRIFKEITEIIKNPEKYILRNCKKFNTYHYKHVYISKGWLENIIEYSLINKIVINKNQFKILFSRIFMYIMLTTFK